MKPVFPGKSGNKFMLAHPGPIYYNKDKIMFRVEVDYDGS